MVLNDPHLQPLEKPIGHQLPAPTTIDRLASASIDLLVIFFIGFVFMAPLRREMSMARLTESEAQFAVSYSLSLFLFFLTCVLYQSLFIAWKSATPGMLVLKLRVVTIWDQERPTWVASLIRGCAWTLGCVLFFIPHLGVLTNERRRPFHDRLADTEMISLNGRYGVKPTDFVKYAMRGFAVSASLCAVIVLANEFLRVTRMGDNLKDWRQELEGVSPQSCQQVEEAEENWEADFHDQVPSRLSLALALYSANSLEDECLATEAFRAFQSGKELELAYLAKSFYHSDDADLSDQYLQKVCSLSSESSACRFSKMIEMWAEQKSDEAGEVFGNLYTTGPLYAKIWAIKHFERIKDFKSELKLIEALWPQKYIAGFLGAHRSVALWGLHRREEARISLLSTVENMDPKDRVELSSWFCYRELAENCEALAESSCKVFLEYAESSSSRLPAPNLLVSYLRAQECKKQDLDFQELASKATGESSFVFLGALENLQNGDIENGLEILRPISSDHRWDKAFREEAARRIILQSKAATDFEEIISEWQDGDKMSWEWRNEGTQLLKRLRELNHHKLALSVGQLLLKHQALDHESRQNLVIMAYSQGLKRQALGFLNLQRLREPANSSKPDSLLKRQNLDEEYYHVRESLLNEFKEELSP